MNGKGNSLFTRFSKWMAAVSGKPKTFIGAVLLVIVWAITGPYFHYSDTWQLVINTGTSIPTFLMVFLIQNTQNRDTTAIQLKLDELIRAVGEAKNELLDLEELDDIELEKARAEYLKLARQAQTGRSGRRTERTD